MNIIDHGKWIPYTPIPHPANLPKNIAFAKRESDGVDWYEYIYHEVTAQPIGVGEHGVPVYPPGPTKYTTVRDFLKSEATVKCAALFWPVHNAYIVGAASFDVTQIFPVNQYAFVIEGYTGTDPQTDFGGKVYDPVALTLADAPILPPLADPNARLDAGVAAALDVAIAVKLAMQNLPDNFTAANFTAMKIQLDALTEAFAAMMQALVQPSPPPSPPPPP